MDLGEKLQTARREKNLTLEEIQEKTKIRTKYLRALEDNKFDVIPGKVYARAFLKEYARQVNLDVNKVLLEFERITTPAEKKQEEKNKNEPAVWFNKRNGFIFIIFVLVCILIYYYFF